MESNIEIAQLLFQQNKYQETIDTCKKILDTDSNSIEAIKLIAKSFLSIRKIDDARLYFNKALNIKPDDFDSIKDLGNTYQAIGDIDNAKNEAPKIVSGLVVNTLILFKLSLLFSILKSISHP